MRPSRLQVHREVGRIDRAMRRASQAWGQTVVWYEFDPTSVADPPPTPMAGTVMAGTGSGPETPAPFDDDLYDEGGIQLGGGTTRRWGKGKTIPVYQAILTEGERQYGDTGTYAVDTLLLIVNYKVLVRHGITDPTDRGMHYNDRIEYDGRLFSVTHFYPQGRIADSIITVTVSATEVKEDERRNDPDDWHD